MLNIYSYLFGKPQLYFRETGVKSPKDIIDVAKEINERLQIIAKNTQIFTENKWKNEFSAYEIYYFPQGVATYDFSSKDRVIECLKSIGVDLSVIDFEEN